ncbi:hypothetical protein GN956_G21922 [Arapaima gigas]
MNTAYCLTHAGHRGPLVALLLLPLLAACGRLPAGAALNGGTAPSRGTRDARGGSAPHVESPAEMHSTPVRPAGTRAGERTLLSVATNSTSPYENSSSESSARGGRNASAGRDSADATMFSTGGPRDGSYSPGYRGDAVGTDRANSGEGISPHGGNETRLVSPGSTATTLDLLHAANKTEEVRAPMESMGTHSWTTVPPVSKDAVAAEEPSSRQPFNPTTEQLQESQPTALSAMTPGTQITSTTAPVPVTLTRTPPSTTATPTQPAPSTPHQTTAGPLRTTGASEQLAGDGPRPGVTLSKPDGSTATHGHTRVTSTIPVRVSTAAEAAGSPPDRPTPVPPATEQTPLPSTAVLDHPCGVFRCANGGTCVSGGDGRHKCACLPFWTGHDCTVDVDECVSAPCPTGSVCENTRGSFTCECPLGYSLENGRSCTRVKTFLGTFRASGGQLNSTLASGTILHEVQREALQLLNASLSSIRGYIRSTLSKRFQGGGQISVVNMFSMAADVTNASVYESVQMFLNSCTPAAPHCNPALQHRLFYRAESLCEAQGPQCDPDRSECTDTDGTAFCQCHSGYFKHNTDDLSCRECDDGFKLENGTCVRCLFGFGGLNCGNFYKLVVVVVSPVGGALLLAMVVALAVTCCRKGKNDINKIIFKSGDFQTSPYVEYRKSNRSSVEWGKESIELQENGSTKNLLQMTDIYYSPPLRNVELERHGLYPFSGLPGSRHSCIYPAQWNPSFISDDTRRRDYF